MPSRACLTDRRDDTVRRVTAVMATSPENPAEPAWCAAETGAFESRAELLAVRRVFRRVLSSASCSVAEECVPVTKTRQDYSWHSTPERSTAGGCGARTLVAAARRGTI